MSVSYHLVPADKSSNSMADADSLGDDIAIKVQNGFSTFAELIINYPDEFLGFFGKGKKEFDYIFSLNESEISIPIFEPQELINHFTDLLNSLKNNKNFPIASFQYFKYEDIMKSTSLYVNLNGKELNKIVKDRIFKRRINYDVSTSFDTWNNYNDYGGKFSQKDTIVHVKSEDGKNYRSILKIKSFPRKIKVNKTLDNINLGKEIKEVHLLNLTPYEHLSNTFNELISICEVCEEKGFGMKSFVSC